MYSKNLAAMLILIPFSMAAEFKDGRRIETVAILRGGKRLVDLENGGFLAHLSTECSVSYCDHSPSVRLSVVRPSTICLLTL